MTYVIGNIRSFEQWRAANRISRRDLLSVRHVPNERAALGLLRPRKPHRVVILDGADSETLRYLKRRGFDL